jgi:hypothetical protein
MEEAGKIAVCRCLDQVSTFPLSKLSNRLHELLFH